MKVNVIATIILLISQFNIIALTYGSFISKHDPLTKATYKITIDNLKKNNQLSAFVPKELPSDARDACFEFMPSILQGNGHTSLFFEASDETVNEYIKHFKDETILPVITIKQYENYKENNLAQFYITIPSYIMTDYPNAEIYVLDTNSDWNHPYSRCFIVDESANLVGFFVGA